MIPSASCDSQKFKFTPIPIIRRVSPQTVVYSPAMEYYSPVKIKQVRVHCLCNNMVEPHKHDNQQKKSDTRVSSTSPQRLPSSKQRLLPTITAVFKEKQGGWLIGAQSWLQRFQHNPLLIKNSCNDAFSHCVVSMTTQINVWRLYTPVSYILMVLSSHSFLYTH